MQNESLVQSQAETEAASERLARLNARLEDLVLARTAELAAARDAAESASRAKSAFLARMSHELRTPLSGMIGMTELARRRATDSHQAEQLEKALGAGHHLLGLIESLIDLSDSEAGRMQLDLAPLAVDEVVAEVVGEMSGPARAAGMALSAEVDPALPARLVGDRRRIGQVVRIFVGNAIKFAPRGRIAVRVRLLDGDARGAFVRIEVADDGARIAPDRLARFFEPFVQADESYTRPYGGAGVGLSLCRSLARLMGGDAGATSGEVGGNTFWATVRLAGVGGS
jgi:signal transduction histidine kinase